MSIASVALSPVFGDSLSVTSSLSKQYDVQLNDSILVFLSVTGSVIPMRVMEWDSIASVKLRIQSFKGFFVKKQKLVFEGRELARNNSCFKDYGVSDGNVLHLVLRLSDLQAIIVNTACGKKFEFQVDRSRDVGYIKQQIAKKKQGVDLIDQELVCDGEEVEDQRLITDICKDNDTILHLLVRKSAKVRAKPLEKDIVLSIEASDLDEKRVDVISKEPRILPVVCQVEHMKPIFKDFILEPLAVNSKIELPSAIKELIKSVFDGLESGNGPIQSAEGSGGVYLMRNSSGEKFVAVFKPIDEEPMALNNPRGLPLTKDGEGLKRGTQVGEGAFREVAAYILDHPRGGRHSFYNGEKGFAGVPPTVMVKCLHRGFNHPEGYECSTKNIKIGSLQMFVMNNGSCEDMGPRGFPVEEVHKITVLDIRLANVDRHGGNILFSYDGEGRIMLTPIDHGYCLPDKFEDCTFDWLYWPQARQPYSPDTVAYIQSLNADEDIELLKFHGWDIPPECARVLRISTMLLKKGAGRKLTPFAIGSIMCRETLKKQSVIEQILQEAEDDVLPETSETTFLESVSLIMDHHLDKLYGSSL
ncbi:hypothetical protein HS088_TW08G00037 [Tripterygium wilfordii]|uniref:1-phosphatidylinositol 4-kinase n=1 Tax=Tripterygium wilfordii TaxID=458696 RepID=A0A7J7DAZ3_TRIWF|nr:phosphatidylinositol 4-kinase gamma 3 [Tripterygium wilfordii]KAF5743454.1 hypothetical protein HS088_TW08G00037 [Tripterygium wilfordii]